MGYADFGGGPALGHEHGANSGRSVTTLVADPARPADVRYDLVVREETFDLASGRSFAGITVNGTSPGPVVEAVQGQLVEVHLRNESVAEGVALHWHGIDVPNAVDGVAGVTQDAVLPGEDFTYRFVAEQDGTFWYHSHQVSHRQVKRGLLGAVVVRPDPAAAGGEATADAEVLAVVHGYGGISTVNGQEGAVRTDLPPGTRARVRIVNTDDGAVGVWTGGAGYRVLAVDGTDLSGPTEVSDRFLLLTAGARADLEIVVPDGGARVQLGGAALVLGPAGAEPPAPRRPAEELDLLSYGSPADVGVVGGAPDRTFRYDIGRRPGFLDGKPGVWWTVNGHLFPDVPMFVVEEGDVVRMSIRNNSGEVHPMHLHGHHALVLSRNGTASTGSPWWVDSLNVRHGETYEIAFVADNPGIWMDHCHNLQHAVEGLVAHLAYTDVGSPFLVGGPAGNRPE